MANKPTTVVHCKKGRFDVYIARGSKWGNPFVIGLHGNRTQVIKQYEEYVRNKKELMAAIPELQGKVLGCFCHPRRCHGDVLAKLVAEVFKNEQG